MDEHGMPEGRPEPERVERVRVVRESRPDVPSGKPYHWQLPDAEQPPLLAFPPAAIAGPLNHAAAFHRAAVERTAAFLVVVSRINGYEGRDPLIVLDELGSGLVAGMLDFDVGVLVDLEARGLVEATQNGCLRLKDIAALDRLSEGD
jgi:hypothetical protein